MAMIFQNFDLSFDDPDYSLEHKQTLTIKPKDLYVHAKLRGELDPTRLENRISRTDSNQRTSPASASPKPLKVINTASAQEVEDMKMTILYGSNSGTCESMAQSLASDASAHGYKVASLGSMDDLKRDIPRNDPNHPLVIITASYEGQPPDNAINFVKSIEDSNECERDFKDISYAVFGCGNHEWTQTFHRIPRLVDRRIEELGGKRLAGIGLADAAGEDMFTSLETWSDNVRFYCL
jgi:cytochrome P450 / NADPH-cytochrome P450 reductase